MPIKRVSKYLLLLSFLLSQIGVTPAQVILQKATPASGSTLGFLIMGTIAQKTPDNNVALIKITASGQVSAVKIGHIIDNKFKVTDVSEKYIRVVTRESKHFLVYLDKFAGEFRISESRTGSHTVTVNPEGNFREDGFERRNGQVTMTSSYRDQIVNRDLSKILMQATAEPVLVGGVIAGFRLFQIEPESIFSKGGLRDDDVIVALNGAKLSSVASAISILKSLKDASKIEVDIVRHGTQQSITIAVH